MLTDQGFYCVSFVLYFSDVNLILSMINGVNLPKMPLQLLGDIVDKAKVKQVNSVKETFNL